MKFCQQIVWNLESQPIWRVDPQSPLALNRRQQVEENETMNGANLNRTQQRRRRVRSLGLSERFSATSIRCEGFGWLLPSVFALLIFCPVSHANAQTDSQWAAKRRRMVDVAVRAAGVTDARVLKSMSDTRRHEFVPRKFRERSYLDAGVPIGNKQTISSPFIVAYMTQSLEPQPTDKVLEIGTGSGYQAAILSPLVKEVYSIEIVESLGKRAAKVLKKLNYKNVFTKIGDGYQGWAEHAPFDKIIVTCSPEDIPGPLVDQLAEGGRIVVPVGERHQQTLYLVEKIDGKMQPQALRPTLFVPMTGKAEDEREQLPDPLNPKLLNSDFEEGVDEKGFVKGWYYQRNLTWKSSHASKSKANENAAESSDIADDNHFVEFNNQVPGQHAHLMQRFSIDGREVPRLRFSAKIACQNTSEGLYPSDLPDAALWFYDEKLHEVGRTVKLGPLRENESWHERKREIRVPIAARTAIVRIGLFGGTGTAQFDNVSVEKISD